MKNDPTALVTKQDLQLGLNGLGRSLRKEIGGLRGEMSGMQEKIGGLQGEVGSLRQEMRDLQKETIREFKVIAENIRKDGIDSHNDKISLLEDRIERVETHVGLSHSLSA